jgi:hypothetical protein
VIEVIGMPDHLDHPLPLRIERGKTELRIEIQSVVAELQTAPPPPDKSALQQALSRRRLTPVTPN